MNRLTTISELYAVMMEWNVTPSGPAAAGAKNAGRSWLAQRRQDMADLATPTGRQLAEAVHHVWSLIDEQLRDLRG